MLRQPGDTQDGVVALQRRSGERGCERDRGTFCGSERPVGGRLSCSIDDAAIGQSDGAVRGGEGKAACLGKGDVDEAVGRAAVDQQRNEAPLDVPTQLE